MKTKICVHKDHVGERKLPMTDFRNYKRSKDGKAAQCKTCADRISLSSNAKRPGHKHQIAKVRRQNLRADFTIWKAKLGCKCCPESEPICLDLHHIDPTEKELNVSDMIGRGWSWKRVMQEAAKCVVLCANCHRKVHADVINLEDYN